MKSNSFSKMENEQLYLSYKTVETQTQRIREEILDVLNNILPISEEIERSDNEKFNKILLEKYTDVMEHIPYDTFIEKWTEEEKIKKEIYKRIQEITQDPKNRQILYLCKKLAGMEMDIDNFIHYCRIIQYCDARE